MNKIFLALLCAATSLAIADVKVINNTEFPIKFGMSWIGPVAYPHDDAATDRTPERTTFNPIMPGKDSGPKRGEMWNNKTEYRVDVDQGEGYEREITAPLWPHEDGNRVITVYTSPDPVTGVYKFKLTSQHVGGIY